MPLWMRVVCLVLIGLIAVLWIIGLHYRSMANHHALMTETYRDFNDQCQFFETVDDWHSPRVLKCHQCHEVIEVFEPLHLLPPTVITAKLKSIDRHVCK